MKLPTCILAVFVPDGSNDKEFKNILMIVGTIS